ncbi:MAG: hypothetical protein GF353_00180 [Candidatus Lokiarchaeota archaeon]|nr:hypothetical protein [Candidatus Lokiarchaeota archaeon]
MIMRQQPPRCRQFNPGRGDLEARTTEQEGELSFLLSLVWAHDKQDAYR